jgi:hypothetical protein
MLRKKTAGNIAGYLFLAMGMITQVRAATPDSITVQSKARFGFSLIFDNRNSFVRNSPVKIYGLNIGLKYKNRYRFGLGAYTLQRDYKDHTYVSVLNPKDTLQPLLDLHFITPNFAYTFLNHRWVELSIPLEIGLGNSHYTIHNTKEELVKDRRGMFVPATAGLGILVKPTRWIGFSGAAGYRMSLMEGDFQGDFDGWYYSYRVNLFLGNILSDYRQNREQKRQNRKPIPPSPQF